MEERSELWPEFDPDHLRFHEGDRLRKAREASGLQVQDMAARMGVGRNTITNYEAGRGIRRAVLIAYSSITGVPMDYLEHGVMPSSEPPLKVRESARTQGKRPTHRELVRHAHGAGSEVVGGDDQGYLDVRPKLGGDRSDARGWARVLHLAHRSHFAKVS